MEDGRYDGEHCRCYYWVYIRLSQYHEARSRAKRCDANTRTIYAWVWSNLWVLHVNWKHYKNRHGLTTSSRSFCSIPATPDNNATTCIQIIEERINQMHKKRNKGKGGQAGCFASGTSALFGACPNPGFYQEIQQRCLRIRIIPSSVSKTSWEDSSLYQNSKQIPILLFYCRITLWCCFPQILVVTSKCAGFQVSKISVLVNLRARSPASNWSRKKRDEMKAHESHRPQPRNQE